MTGGTVPGPPASPEVCEQVRSLYVHTPFCEKKCRYCDFTSVAGLDGQESYVAALRSELRLLAAAFPACTLDTVFVGGGTPGLLDTELLRSIMEDVHTGFRVAPRAEVTLEANPSSTSASRAAAWLEAGFNRVSLGVQSLEPDVLGFLGRVHDGERAVAAVGEVRDAGFEAVNCDLIYAVPGLDDDRWTATLERVIALDPGHISCYELTVEPGTALHVAVAAGRAPAVDEGAALRHHRIALAVLERAGYHQYEVSNFARPGSECRHNLAYWRNRHYLAAGVGAHGHVPAEAAAALGVNVDPGAVGVRYWHPRGLPAYTRIASSGLLPIGGHESVDGAAREVERLMLGLRLSEGVAGSAGPAVEELAGSGLVTITGGVIRTTPAGQEVLNEVAARIAV